MAKKRRPASDTGRATEEMLTDSGALDQIRGLLASRPWDAEAVGQIAMFLRETGRDIEEPEGGSDAEDDELGADDGDDEGWFYGDTDPSEDMDPNELTIESSAYARISRMAGQIPDAVGVDAPRPARTEESR